LREIELKVGEGAREITLLGQIVNKYGQDLEGEASLASLLRFLDEKQVSPRLRFLTTHPRHFDEDFAVAMGELPSVCEEINLPIQAGDDLVLKRMGRGYNVDFFRSRIDLLRTHVPNVAVSTDVIVGFPGETHEQFNRTLDVLTEIEFDVVHVAAFSARVGTVAAKWPDDVSPEEKLDRLHEAEAVQETIARDINSRLVGSLQEVLFEELRPSPVVGGRPRWAGRTRSSKLVFCESAADVEAGDIRDVEIVDATAWSLRGEVAASVAVA
jgi:tRNA-2-methylthio-N6-dimethylallyladenosine synthase